MSQKPAVKRKRRFPAGVAVLCALCLAAAMYAAGGVWEYRGAPNAAGEIAESRALLEAMERRAPVDLDAEMHRQYLENLKARNGIMVDDLEAEQRKILALQYGDVSKADVARWFSDAVVVGDSIVRAAANYEWLGKPPVIAEGGAHLSVDLELFDAVEAARPSVIFLCFGMNDVGVFEERVDRYVSRYAACIQRLQASLPDAVIYVHAALPVTDAAVAERATYGYIGAYNEAMKAACPDLGVYYVDSGFILEAMPELYNVDGRHPKREFYPMWLTYLADVAGLSDE